LLVIRCPDISCEARAFLVFVDAAQNVAQSRVLGFGEWLAGAALKLAVARDQKSLIKAGTPRIRTF
jgi:hypothetical protein